MFCLPWLLTWFSHTLNDIEQVYRIFDFLLCQQPYFIIYLCASLLLNTKQWLLDHVKEEQEGGEMGVIYTFYQNIKNVPFDLEVILQKSVQLEQEVSFYKIQQSYFRKKLKQLPPNSVLHDNVINERLVFRKHIGQFRKYKYWPLGNAVNKHGPNG